jgi:hypothetical protein
MWSDEKIKELKERISSLSDEELLNIVEVERDDYRKEAIDFARDELTTRGIGFQGADNEEEVDDEQTTDSEMDTSWATTCERCGGKTRPGMLLEDKEITILFTDKDEHRFLELYACSQCGNVQFAVDFDTDVDGR